MIYSIFGVLIRLIVSQFFKTIHITGAPQLLSGPILFTPNHPNQAVDPFIMGVITKRSVSFVAKSTLFKNPVLGAFFRSLNMIPVYRKSDAQDISKNEETFRAVAEALKEQKAIVIFPEGTSSEARKLLPLKTGAARMALLAESESNFTLGVQIQPVSITYSDPYTFQSSVTITFGEPIAAAEYRDAYLVDPQNSVKLLTQRVEKDLRVLSVNVNDLTHQPLVEKVARLFSSSGIDDRTRFQEIATHVEAIAPHFPEKKKEIELRLQNYFDIATAFNLEHYHPYFDLPQSTVEKSGYLLLSPFILIGILTHAVPYYSIRALLSLLRVPTYNFASFKIGLSALLFPLWYLAVYIVVHGYTLHHSCALIVIFSMLFTGYLANRFFDRTWLTLIQVFWPANPDPVTILNRMRDTLRNELRDLVAASKK